MPPLLRYFLRRILFLPVSLLVITMVLYGMIRLTPTEVRAQLYMPKQLPARLTQDDIQRLIQQRIEIYHLDDPFPIQYVTWLRSLASGNWGYSPSLRQDVLDVLIERTPATAELAIYSILVFLPLGLLSGVLSGERHNRPSDHQFRLAAFIATSLPPFILALFCLAVFYIALGWFSPGRLDLKYMLELTGNPNFRTYTGLLTIDGLLNGRPEISLNALRHLVMPVVTLALVHWATLGRITRAAMIEESHKEYILAARARGISEKRIVWRHTLRNAFSPGLTSSLLSAASLVTGIFVVEIIYQFNGISRVAVSAMQGIPDAPAALGFAIYSVIAVLLIMLVLDLLLAMVDPRIRQGIQEA